MIALILLTGAIFGYMFALKECNGFHFEYLPLKRQLVSLGLGTTCSAVIVGVFFVMTGAV